MLCEWASYPLVATLSNMGKLSQPKRKLLKNLRRRASKSDKSGSYDCFLAKVGLNFPQLRLLYAAWAGSKDDIWNFWKELSFIYSSVGILLGGEFLSILDDIHRLEEAGRQLDPRKSQLVRSSYSCAQIINGLSQSVSYKFSLDKRNLILTDEEVASLGDVMEEWVHSDAKDSYILKRWSDNDRKWRKWDFFQVRRPILPYNRVGEKWASILTNYVNMVPKEYRSFIVKNLRLLFLSYPDVRWHEGCILDALKELTSRIKKEASKSLSGIGGYLIDLGQLGGFDTVYNQGTELFEKWAEEFEESKLRVNKARSDPLFGALKKNIRKVVREWGLRGDRLIQPVDFEGFISDRGNWTKSGSCTLPARKIQVKAMGKDVKTQVHEVRCGDKETTTLFYSNDELVSLALDREKGLVSYPFRKGDEPAKARVVVNHSMESYLRVSYLDWFLAKGPEYTSLEKGTRATKELYSRMKTLLEQGSWGISLDYSSWDTSVTTPLVKTVVDSVGRLIKEGLERSCRDRRMKDIVSQQVEKIVELEIFSLDNMEYELPSGQRLNGRDGFLSSGYKWTAVANTIINRALFMTITQAIGEKRVVFSAHQGDDVAVLLKASDLYDAERFVKNFSSVATKLGFNINPSKTSVDPSGVEFLRYWVTPDGVFGYPGRMARTLLWSKPDLGGGGGWKPWLTRILEISESGKIAIRRGLSDAGRCVRRIVNKAIPKNLLPAQRSKLIHWLSTSPKRGGCGCPGYWDGTSRRDCKYIPRLAPAFDVYLPRAVSSALGGGAGPSSEVYSWRLREVIRDRIPLKGVRPAILFDVVVSKQKRVDLKTKVEQVSRSAPLTTDIPEPWPTAEDGAGWWVQRIWGQMAMRRSDRNDDSWTLFLSDRFKGVLRRYGVRPSKSLVAWGESNRQPPPVASHWEEISLWEERLSLEDAWRVFFSYGILRGTSSERAVISGGIRPYF